MRGNWGVAGLGGVGLEEQGRAGRSEVARGGAGLLTSSALFCCCRVGVGRLIVPQT